MDRFIARANIDHFRERLMSETDSTIRSALQRLLVEEEDKLAKDLELLADLARATAKFQQRIEKQRVLVETLEGDGRDGAMARTLLNGLTESLILHQAYHQRVATRVEQSPL
jgi:hypothetical protein